MRKYLTFIAGGGLGFGLAVATTTILTEIFNLWYALSYALGLSVGTMFKFVYHRTITFNKTNEWKNRFVKFILLVTVLNVVNWLLVFASTETIAGIFQEEVKAIYYLTTIFLVSGVLSIVNFGFNKYWVFRN